MKIYQIGIERRLGIGKGIGKLTLYNVYTYSNSYLSTCPGYLFS